MLTGKIQWFDQSTGYGFIRPDQAGVDVFFHRSAFQDSEGCLQKGGEVSFTTDATERGPEAILIYLRGVNLNHQD